MNEGRAELQRVILQYEKQRAEAIRSKQEAEIVLPFMRAALEELDAALGQSESGELMERVHSQVQSGKARASQIVAEPSAPVRRPEPAPRVQEPARPVVEERPKASERASSITLMSNSSVFNDEESEETDEPAAKAVGQSGGQAGFNRASIASLIDEAGKADKGR